MRPASTQRLICLKNDKGTAPNSPPMNVSWVSLLRFSCRHSAGKPLPYVKLTILHTVLSHSWCTARTSAVSDLGTSPGAFRLPRRPHAGLRNGVSSETTGTANFSFCSDHHGTTGWSDTALVTIVRTSGVSPATADIANDVEP